MPGQSEPLFSEPGRGGHSPGLSGIIAGRGIIRAGYGKVSVMKIAIVVHGRFYAFDLARVLIERGHDAEVFTNYPVWVTSRFGLPPERVRSFWPHGVLCRAFERLGVSTLAESFTHTMFGRWAAKQLRTDQWDVIHSFSGVAAEVFSVGKPKAQHLMVRGSSHIAYQDEILAEESERTGARLERPTPWKIRREEGEYQNADRILVLSRFAYETFIAKGIASVKLALLPLGVGTGAFRLSEEILEERCRRILSGKPLTVLFTGLLNFRKGLYDFAEITRALHKTGQFRFRVVGTVTKEARQVAATLPSSVELVQRQRESDLARFYAESDLFLFPTLEDGYAVVLAQAQAAALPLLTTTNCAGPDMIREGETGWVMPIRNANAFIERLLWCDANREELAHMVRRIHTEFHPRDWRDVAVTFEEICQERGVEAH